MTHFVLVPGACHGGWWYEPVVAALEGIGHPATAITLTGLDPDAPPVHGVNLEQHVAELDRFLQTQPGPVALVGHSYAGSVITGAADRRPDRVEALFYLDAFVPADGESCIAMTNESQQAWYLSGAESSGLAVEPLPFFDPRARAQPIGTLLQRCRLTGAWQSVPRKTYALAADPAWLPDSPFPPFADRLRSDPDWTVVELPATHNVLRDGPDLLVELLTSDPSSR